ncbi:MAG TPA: hypothetical protein VFM24_08155 [Nitrospira sp.]|jgi:hypothetical protein|nr:hypothetical protein [Nitrospira sp.]
MISTFDLALLGSLVSAGGLVFLRQGKWPHLRFYNLGTDKRTIQLSAESRDHLARATALAGARWLTVGSLTLFIAYVHGADEGYLFSPWSDVLFHLVFVATCWIATAYRMNQAAEKIMTVTLSMTSRGQSGT